MTPVGATPSPRVHEYIVTFQSNRQLPRPNLNHLTNVDLKKKKKKKRGGHQQGTDFRYMHGRFIILFRFANLQGFCYNIEMDLII